MASPTESSRSSKPLVAAFASAIVPGAGQFIAGNARRGRLLLIVDVAILAVLAFFFRDKVQLLTMWIQPSSLALMMVGNILLLGYRVWAADDAYRTAKTNFGDAATASAAAVLVGVTVVTAVLVLPHVVFGYYDVVQYDLITSVFGGNSTASDTTTTQPAPPSTDASGNTVATTAPSTTTTAPPAKIYEGDDRLNILLIGGDFGEGRTGIRTDTMITVSIDPVTGESAMFSVPRNWTYAPLPEGMGVWDCDCYPELINELWVMGEQYPQAFPGPGTPSENAVKGVIGEFLGIDIDYYAMVNLDGFVDIVDALGGVNIYVPEKVVDANYPHEDGTVERIEIDQGWQELDGHLALAYARTRNQDSDYFRMNRQRCVIEAMMEDADPTSLVLNFGKLADVIKQTMLTDIPIEALPQLIELLPAIDLDNVVSVRFIPPEYHLKYRDDGKPGRVANIDLVHEHVQLVINDPERAVSELGLEQLEDVCGVPSA
ncbi:MAG: LCP family protein [Actinomycetota bacterium]